MGVIPDSSEEWKSSTKRETLLGLEQELEKLCKTAPPESAEFVKKELAGFRNLFSRFLRVKTTVNWKKIQPLPDHAIIPYSEVQMSEVSKEMIAERLNKLVVVKLNGGLGTSMGCKGPKSVISVRNDLTFLDLTMQQIQHLNRTYDVNVPLVLMNSFNTDEDTQRLLRKYANVRVDVHSFCQSKYPRIFKESHMPVPRNVTDSDLEGWYPPGHGNFYEAFYNSGLLDKFIEQGKQICFVSNIDNMGATVDLNILNFVAHGRGGDPPEFVMEVTDKTRADVKGGTLIEYEDRIMLLEIAQVPKDYVDEFKSVSKFRIFNTNNLWVRLDAVKRVIEKNELEMEVIVNPKHLEIGIDVVQLETAAGAAIKNFKGSCGVNVPRSRFLPVKKTSDLLLLMSNLYDIDSGSLTLSTLRSFPTTPLVKLGSSFDKVKDFLARFQGIPDLLELDHLTVSGDVWFGKDVSLKGTVIIIANHGDRIDIPPGTILENKIVSGNLRILDH
ncbi:UTP--glucose-1-phosphate uridylyltransferase [Toxocara canis]|uniref:UTP--glucose-1-phosphate uridylyltransferase n=1 Tax=Toxocara canis TaxID=6265 RepID=A0A0B2UVR3_TOXCA|nr:UTP--glucose-1-phosphate uridylyltransferase [Toxocara canis]